jgi:hypothetical protein
VRILADLHNHSCLSPCASLEESPSLIARLGAERGLGLIALTDHNSALNCPAFALACRREGLIPVYGLEASSVEEVHVLCLFATLPEALSFSETLRALLIDVPYDPEKLGDEVVVDADELVLDLPDYYLGASLSIGFDGLCAEAARRGAIVIPAHVDRPMFSVSSQLGFLPPGPYDAVESMREPPPELTLGHCAISGSDSHYPEHVCRRPSAIELPDDLLAASRSIDARASAEAELFAALREALREGRAEPYWAGRA